MFNKFSAPTGSTSLMNEYASLLSEAALRNRMRSAEHAARIEAEISSKVKSEFIANMSHELRTPLNTIIGFSKLLAEHQKRALPDVEIVQYAHLINDAAAHLLAVINDILDITKMQAGRYTLDARDIQVVEVLDTVVDGLRLSAEKNNQTLTYESDTNLETVRGDAVKLRQIFTNLLNNAIKFTPEGGHVHVEVRRRLNGGVGVLFRDTGIGMTEDEIAIALMPFGQVDGSRTRWREGTGLGLSIASALVDLHGGKLDIRSTSGKGTDVAVLFPPRSRVSIAEGRDILLGNGASKL
ncbi:MAG: ATP-binding protein [Pseudomonadota bacterium]